MLFQENYKFIAMFFICNTVEVDIYLRNACNTCIYQTTYILVIKKYTIIKKNYN